MVFSLQFLDQLKDLGLGSDVESRRRLVGDDQLRIEDEGHRDHGALALATGYLVGIGPQHPFRVGQPHAVERGDRPRAALRRRQIGVHLNQLVDLLADGHQRIQCGHRLLKHHRNLVAAELAKAFPGHTQKVFASEVNFTAYRPHVRPRQQSQDCPAGKGLPGPGFSDEAHDLVAPDLEVDPLSLPLPGRPYRSRMT